MSKYDSFAQFLRGQDGPSITMTFDQIERIVDGGLPGSAYDHRPWWANRYDGKDAQNLGWQSAGWETKDVDMAARRVTFVKVKPTNAPEGAKVAAKSLTIDEAKKGLAAAFGVSPDAISITISA